MATDELTARRTCRHIEVSDAARTRLGEALKRWVNSVDVEAVNQVVERCDDPAVLDEFGDRDAREAPEILQELDSRVRKTTALKPAREPVVTLPARPQPTPRESRPRSRRTRARAPSGDPDSEPEPPRRCAVCGGSLAGRRRHAVTCGGRCRVALHRSRQRTDPPPRAAPLDADTRAWLRYEIDRHRRDRVARSQTRHADAELEAMVA